MSLQDRKAGYETGLSTAGEWLKTKLVGLITDGKIILRNKANLKEGYYLFALSKEEIEELALGRLPK